MSEDAAIESFDLKGLDQIIKALKIKPPSIKIGILGGGMRTTGKLNNATVGAAHEFGTTTLPQRSFLRVPLTDFLSKEMESSGALDKDAMAKVIKSGSVRPWLDKIAILAEKIVLGAFDSQGYGKWEPWRNPSYQNNTGMVLVDTQQLRNSITTEVIG